jgi:hypothetical protein
MSTCEEYKEDGLGEICCTASFHVDRLSEFSCFTKGRSVQKRFLSCWTGRTTNMGFLTNPGNRGIITLLLRLTQIKKVPARPSKFQLGQGRLLFTVN